MDASTLTFDSSGMMQIQPFNHALIRFQMLMVASKVAASRECHKDLALMCELRLEEMVMDGEWSEC
jgi:hypothetical protein